MAGARVAKGPRVARPAPSRPARGGSNGGAPGLNRERIVQAALDIIEVGGISALNMRDLSERLGVTLGATYRHVGSKDELLRLAAVDLLLSVEIPGPETGDWRARLRTFLLDFIEKMSRYPGVVTYVLQNSKSPDFRAQRRVDPAQELLLEAGFSPEVARQWAQATSFYVTGVLLMDIQGLQQEGLFMPDDIAAGLDLIMNGMGSPGRIRPAPTE